MKFIVFASCIHVDTLSLKGADKFLEDVADFHCMPINEESDYLTALKKVERYGSFMFVSKSIFNALQEYSDI